MTDNFWKQRQEEKHPIPISKDEYYIQYLFTETLRTVVRKVISRHIENGTWNKPFEWKEED